MHTFIQSDRVAVRFAGGAERERIHRLRHEVYACELGQYAETPEGILTDPLENQTDYIVAVVNEVILGFVAITRPEAGRFAMERHLRRAEMPELHPDGLQEVRLLTVLSPFRGREIALLLMYAAFRLVESRGGDGIAAVGRKEVLGLYLRVGLKPTGSRFQAGRVTYELLTAKVSELEVTLRKFARVLNRMERGMDWELGCAFRKPAACFHGGAFFDAIGTDFRQLDRRHGIINADVLDAWFPPSPRVISRLQEGQPWILQTSPPADAEGLVDAISDARGIPARNILPGAGSSALIFLALRHWLTSESRVLLLDPTYGEYAHVLEEVVRCRVDRFPLFRRDGYRPDLEKLSARLRRNYSLAVLVNPNSPTGIHVPREQLERVLRGAPFGTRVWVDETYVDYVGADQSLERFASQSPNVFVCKSMSKMYALSGMRVAYLCGPAGTVEELRAITPPWAVGLPAQIAAVAALRDARYYSARHVETHLLRDEFRAGIENDLGWEVVPGRANFLLCHLPETGACAAEWVRVCRQEGLFLRDASTMGLRLGRHALRIAVKDGDTNRRMLRILRQCADTLRGCRERDPFLLPAT